MVEPEQNFLVRAYRQVARLRSVGELALARSTGADPHVAGSVHTCIGQEAVLVGALAALRRDDQVVATYRGHGWAVVVHDANLTSGFGAEIAARLHERHGAGVVRVRRVASPDIRVPAALSLQQALLPDAAAIVRAAKLLVPARQLQAVDLA